MLTELSVVEQRYKTVLEVLEHGAKVTDVAVRYGVERRTIQRWISRYSHQGLGALADRSFKPQRCPHQMHEHIEARILEMRSDHPDWGPEVIVLLEVKDLPHYIPVGRSWAVRAGGSVLEPVHPTTLKSL